MSTQKKWNGKVAIVVLLLGILVFAANAFALSPGQSFTFEDINPIISIDPEEADTWILRHTLFDSEFDPALSGNEIIDILSATLTLNLTYTAEQQGKSGEFQLKIKTELDEINLGLIQIKPDGAGPYTTTFAPISLKEHALRAISEDKSARIELEVKKGTLHSVNSSTLSGNGVVAPEPVSMLLVGVGMLGLPFLLRSRRLAIKG